MDWVKIRKYWWGCIFDQYYGNDSDDVTLLLELIGKAPQNIFEVCCGTGRVLVPLAKAGHRAIGVDADEGMLARLPAKTAGLANLRYSQGDALTTDWGGGYDVVILASNTLMNIEHREDDEAAQRLF
jgi:SAM-dependent methyltransferase